MGDTKTCPRGHIHDIAWSSCPYCQDESASENRRRVASLIVLPETPAARRFDVHEGTTVIGKEQRCDIILEEDFISGRHARIEAVSRRERWRFVLTDLGSTNGTFLNDAEDSLDQGELRDGDLITLGELRLLFRAH